MCAYSYYFETRTDWESRRVVVIVEISLSMKCLRARFQIILAEESIPRDMNGADKSSRRLALKFKNNVIDTLPIGHIECIIG